MVDEDASELIEFEEFLQIIKGGKASDDGSKMSSKEEEQASKIYKFFKDFTEGTLLFLNKFKRQINRQKKSERAFLTACYSQSARTASSFNDVERRQEEDRG